MIQPNSPKDIPLPGPAADGFPVTQPPAAGEVVETPAPFSLEPRVFSTQVKKRRHTATYMCAITPEGDVLAQREMGEDHSGDIYAYVSEAAYRKLDALKAAAEEEAAKAKEGQLFSDVVFVDQKAAEIAKKSIFGISSGTTAVEASVQLTLDGMTPVEKRKTGKVAFGKFVKPELYDVFGEHNFNSLTDAEKKWDPHAALSKALFEPPNPEKGEKPDDNMLVVDGYGLNAYEYGLLIRYPNALARKTVSKVLGDSDITEEKLAASERGVVHVLEKMTAPMQTHLVKLLEARQEIKDLAKEASSPGFAHQGEEWMKQHVSTVWKEFQIMLDVTHVQRGWSDEKRQVASTALLYYLTQDSQQVRTGRWQKLIQLADGYLGARASIFRNRIEQSGVKISTKQNGQVAR